MIELCFSTRKEWDVRVFITGATGFVGGHVARRYAAEGAQLRLLTRKTSNLDSLAGLNAETVVGDLRAPEALRSALRGCDALVHVAADYRLWVPKPNEMYAANVDGTRALLKLARELVKKGTGRTLYVLDEPTTGLHFDDVRKLLEVLHGFTALGNTVVVIEHNLDVVKTADWVIDLGPEGGSRGGLIIATGTPEQVAKVEESYTGQFLKKFLPA